MVCYTDGDGAPEVYFTGHHGRYYIMLMDLLGRTPQLFLENCPPLGLPWQTVAIFCRKCLQLFRKIH